MPMRVEKGMALNSENENEKDKKSQPRSHVFYIFTLFAVTKTIILVAVFFYFYTCLMESRENITMLQNKMLSMEKVCVELARLAVKSQKQVDNLQKAKLSEPVSQSYSGDDYGEPDYDSSQPEPDYLLRSNATNNPNQSDDQTFNSYETTLTTGDSTRAAEGSTLAYQEEERTDDDIYADLCDIKGLEELEKFCEEQRSRRGRVKRSNQRGPVATHFKGGLPETFVRDSGLIAPWYPDSRASSDFGLSYAFREGKGKVEVEENGLYLIYAQVYYLTNQSPNSYVVNIRERDAEITPVAFCSSNAVVPQHGGITEVSCYTSVVRHLNASTEVFLTQRDRNRRMILREGHTFLGLVRLNKRSEHKRRQGNRN